MIQKTNTSADDASFQRDNEILKEATRKAADAAASLAASLETAARTAARSTQQAESAEQSTQVIVRATRDIAKNLSDHLRTVVANAAGKYREGQRGSYNEQYRELTEKILQQNPRLTEQEARGYARSQMSAEAKYELDSQNPLKKAKMEKAQQWALKRMAAGGEGLLDGVEKIVPGSARPWEMNRFRTPGLGLTPRVSPAEARSANGSQTAPGKTPASNVADTARSILDEIRQINQSLSTFNII